MMTRALTPEMHIHPHQAWLKHEGPAGQLVRGSSSQGWTFDSSPSLGLYHSLGALWVVAWESLIAIRKESWSDARGVARGVHGTLGASSASSLEAFGQSLSTALAPR
jgi:hypothetical protein